MNIDFEHDEEVYDLNSVIPELDGELILGDDGVYIMSGNAYFSLKSLQDFKSISDTEVMIKNEDGDYIKMTVEQYKFIYPILKQKFTNN